MDEDEGNVGFEEGMAWLTSHVLDEACDYSKVHLRHQRNQEHRHRFKNCAETLPLVQHSKSNSKPHHRARHPTNWASGGPGMQAIFLDSGRKSGGTGVFLPRRTSGNDLQPIKKPVCSPVLLPSRVVQALNLNVHELGLQISPQRDSKNSPKIRDCNSDYNKEDVKDVSTQFCVVSQKRNSSPEIFLPKEWTY